MFAEYLKEHDLFELMRGAGKYRPFPRRQERDAWKKIPQNKQNKLIALGNEALQGYPMITATSFMAFSRTGDREVYQKPYFARRDLLVGAVLAECLLDDERYMDAVIDGLWCICEESTWVLSAHNGSDHPGLPPMNKRLLPDVSNPYVDLFAAQTAAALAEILYLIEDKLDVVSPLIARRVRSEIDSRVITPFMTHDDFWWMGVTRQDLNNWTPWIVSNVMETMLHVEKDEHRKCEGIARGMRMLDGYLAVMPEDGGCDEGAAYFNMAGGALADALQCVYLATGGKADFYNEPHIRNIAAFPLFAHIAGEYYLNFADCDARPMMDGERIYHLDKKTGNAGLTALGSRIFARHEDVRLHDTPQMNRVLYTLFADIPHIDAPEPPAFSALPDLQVYTWRKNGLYIAIKGGNNGESHNHNDIGSFVIYADGNPQVIDVGNCVYTAKTFGSERYSLMNTRSCNHNVPLVGDIEQAAGREYAAKNVNANENGIRLDIGMAYPAEAEVLELKRELQVSEEGVLLSDCVALSEPKSVTWVFMLRGEPIISEGRASFGALKLKFDSDLRPSVEEVPVTDKRMAKSFPGSVWRLALQDEACSLHEREFLFQRS